MGLERGDIPRGGFLGSIAHAIGGGIKGFITGGPAGAIGGAAGAAIRYNLNQGGGSSGAAAPIGSAPPPIPSNINIAPLNTTSADELIRQHQVSIHKGQASGAIAGRPGAGAKITTAQIVQHQLGAGRMMGRRRTMRVTNVKALRRAIRRATGFSKLAMKVIKVVNPQRKGRFGGWKKGRKR